MILLPNPKEHETIHDYLDRLGYYWADLWSIDDVLFLHEDYSYKKTAEENHLRTDISKEQAIDILQLAKKLTDARGDGLHGYQLLEFSLEEIQSKEQRP